MIKDGGLTGRETLFLAQGRQLYLESAVADRNHYDRLLRDAWLDFGDGEVDRLNEAMVRSGYAARSTYPPDGTSTMPAGW